MDYGHQTGYTMTGMDMDFVGLMTGGGIKLS